MNVFGKKFEIYFKQVVLPTIDKELNQEFEFKVKFSKLKHLKYSKSNKSGFTLKSGTVRILEPKEKNLTHMFKNLQQVPVIIYNKSEEKTSAFNTFYQDNCYAQFIVIIHWIYKKRWNPKHKIPANRVLAKQLEPVGDFYISILDLCNAVYELQTFLGYNSLNYVLWFEKIILELRHIEMYERLPAIEDIKPKEEAYREECKVLENIKNFKNPINKCTQPYYYDLLEKTFYLIKTKRYENLEKNQWKKFISAYNNQLKIIRTNKYTACTDGESYYLVKKRGKVTEKHKINLS